MLAVLATLTALVSACTDDPPAAGPNVPAFTSSAPPSAAADKSVPRTCGGLATLAEVTDILGAAITGETLTVVGVPESKIGRTGRLDCYYGVPAGKTWREATVWIAFAGYTDSAAAQRRMTTTVETEREAGAVVNEVAVGAGRGILLASPANRTLVAVRGKNTVAVTVVPTLVADDNAGSLLARLADHALTPRP